MPIRQFLHHPKAKLGLDFWSLISHGSSDSVHWPPNERIESFVIVGQQICKASWLPSKIDRDDRFH